jgi:hypothetical protein
MLLCSVQSFPSSSMTEEEMDRIQLPRIPPIASHSAYRPVLVAAAATTATTTVATAPATAAATASSAVASAAIA